MARKKQLDLSKVSNGVTDPIDVIDAVIEKVYTEEDALPDVVDAKLKKSGTVLTMTKAHFLKCQKDLILVG